MSSPPVLPLAVRQAEKDRFGEVFTPSALINAMLDKLPPSVWTDPTKKWLDPAAGFGNFFMEVYPRLMKSLEHVIPEPSQRRRHILTQMLYMVEYNEESCQRIRENPMFVAEAGGTEGTEGVNLFCGNFLDLDPLSPVFRSGTTSFDIIVGNPPFNADQTHEGKKGGGANLWPKFVETSLRGGGLLKPDGFLLFVHPALWRKPPSPRAPTLFELMTHENHMLYLEIHNKLDGKRVFGVQTRYDFYVIQKRKPTLSVSTSTTFIKDQNGEEHPSFDLSRWKFLPNHSYEIIEPLLRSSDDTSEPIVIFSRGKYGTDKPWVHDDEKQRTPEDIPLIHSTPLSGPRFLWSDPRVKCEDVEDCAPMVGVPKVIFGESGINKVVIDVEGRYGMTQGAIGLRIPSVSPDEQNAEARQMATALESDIFSRILDAMSFSNFRIDWRMFLYLRADFYRHPMFSGAKSACATQRKTSKRPREGIKKPM